MLDIADACKELYKQDSIAKDVIINFYSQKSKLFPSSDIYPADTIYPSNRAKPELTFNKGDVVSESMSLTEGICDSDKISYRGCVSSALSIELTNVDVDVQDMEMEVIQTMQGYRIPIFNGIVDTATRNGAKTRRKIKAYDYLYYRYDENMINWYNSISFPIKLKDFRISLYRAYNMPYSVQSLVNDDIYINKAEVDEINGRELLKMIGEFNGAFVHIDRTNQIKYVSLERYNYIYPSDALLPCDRVPGAQTDAHGFEAADSYIDCEYGDYEVQEINRITVKQDNAVITSYGTGTNTYEITENILFYGMDESVIQDVLSNIYTKIGGIYYLPHKTRLRGRPYVECGDVINVQISEKRSIDTYVFKRTLKGVQSLIDTYWADGEEYHSKLYEVEEWTE